MKESPCDTCTTRRNKKYCNTECKKWASWFSGAWTETRIAGQLAKTGMLDEFIKRKKEMGLK